MSNVKHLFIITTPNLLEKLATNFANRIVYSFENKICKCH